MTAMDIRNTLSVPQYLLFECVIETERDNLLGVGTLEEMAQLVPISNRELRSIGCDASCVLDIFRREGQYQTEHYIYTVIPWTGGGGDGPIRSGPISYVNAIDHGLHGHYLLLHEHHGGGGGGGGGGLDFWEYETQTEAEQKFLEIENSVPLGCASHIPEDAMSVVMWGITAY